jgi:uncharacterized protein YodC (DUF2158 family)
MNKETIDRELRAANPVAPGTLAALDLDAAEAALGAGLFGESAQAGESEVAGHAARRRSRPRHTLLALASATAAAVATAIVLVGGGAATHSPAPAYGAELVRFAESTPLLLLEGPGWHVRSVDEVSGGEGMMQFVSQEPGLAEHQRWVDLSWDDAKLSEVLRLYFDGPIDRVPGRKVTTRIPALGATAYIDTRAESAPRYGGPGDHQMVAVWKEGGRAMVLDARAPDLAAFRERLDWLRRVDAQTWLAAMPPRVVKAADYGATVREMLHGIPLPSGFDPASIPDLRLTTDRYQVGAAVGGAVACEWFNRWGEARASHDTAAAQEAERVLLHSERQWPIFREMSKQGAYPATVVEYAKAMPSGRWYGRPLLSAIDSDGGLCGPRSAASGG